MASQENRSAVGRGGIQAIGADFDRLGRMVKSNFATQWNFSLPLILGAAAFLFAILNGNNLLNDGDTYWHIATGQWIVQHIAIPHSDPFSYTLTGTPWTAHEWLSEVVLFLAYQAGGWTSVVALTAAAFAAALAFWVRFLLRYLAPIYVLFFFVLAVAMAAGHLLARPHLLAMPLLLIWSAGLIRACEESRAPSLWLLGIMAIWANLHGGFTIGIALAAAFAIEAVWLGKDTGEWRGAARRWAIFIVLATLAGMLTPNGIEGILFTAKVLAMSYALSNIGEWLSPDFQKFQILELWLLLLILVALTRGLRLSPARMLILLGLIHLSLKHVRYIEILGLLSPLLLAEPIGAQWSTARASAGSTQKLDEFFRRRARPAGLAAIVTTYVFLGAISFYEYQEGVIGPPKDRHTVAAIQAVKNSGITGHVFNTYDFGGYLIFSGIPVYIDGRADMYGDEFMKRYLDAYRNPQVNDLESLLDKYNVRWTLLRPSAPGVAYLDHLKNWRREYADDTAVVHVRIDAEGAVP